MVPTNLTTLTVIVLVCAVATGGLAAGVDGATDLAVGSDERPAVTDRTAAEPADGASSTAGETEARQQNNDTVEFEPGETVTGEVQNQSGFVFDIDPGERATIKYTWKVAEDSQSATGIEVEVPDGRTVPEESPDVLIVSSGETVTLNVTRKKAGQARIRIDTGIFNEPTFARGTFQLSLPIEQTGEVPDEPNNDRANATVLELNTTKAAELESPRSARWTSITTRSRSPSTRRRTTRARRGSPSRSASTASSRTALPR